MSVVLYSVSLPSSLSARRAWIEIKSLSRTRCACWVALRKESVDRNTLQLDTATGKVVALRKESVDRNIASLYMPRRFASRSPQGERG